EQFGCRVPPAQREQESPHGRLPLAALLGLMHQLGDDDPDLGLRLGALLQPSSFAVTGHLVMASTDLLQDLPLIERYQDLVMDCVRLHHRVERDTASLAWHFDDDGDAPTRRRCIDALMAAMRQFGIWLTGITDPFSATQFAYPRPRDTH